MHTLFFHTTSDLLLVLLYAAMLMLVGAMPALLDRLWLLIERRRRRSERKQPGLHTPFSWLSMFVVPLVGILFFLLMVVAVRDGLVLFGWR